MTREPQEVAAGFILYRLDGADLRVLLMRNAHHGTWGVPKGHLEPGEDIDTAAARELEEETGLSPDDIARVDGFHVVMQYDVRSRESGEMVPKDVHLFLASVTPAVAERIERSHEHDDIRWEPVDVACELAHYDEMVDALRQAERAIRDRTAG